MANYNQVSYGSQGSDVTELQKLLNKNGYNLSADGIFGSKTQAAVKDYQKKNGLAVDGIAGTNTWGALTKDTAPTATNTQVTALASTANLTKPSTGSTTPTTQQWSYDPFKVSDSTAAADKNRQEVASQKPGDFTYGSYEKSDVVKQAEALLQQQLANKPGAYQSSWQSQLDDTLSKILNREKFAYDLNGDALYQQYKDQYMTQGQQAMMDTMGQAAALTGGYGSSYSQSVGQQAYQMYLQQLNDVVPELYQLALDQYNREGQDLYNQYGLYDDRENQDYSRYRDALSDYYTEVDRLTEDARYQSETDYDRFMDLYNMAYGQHRDDVSDWQYALARADEDYWNQYSRDYGQYTDNRNLSYQQNRDQISDNQWDQSFQYQQDRDKVADQQWQTEFDESKRQYDQQYALSSGKTGTTDDDPYYTGNEYKAPDGWDTAEVKAFQKSVCITQDGIWGPETQKLYENRTKDLDNGSLNPSEFTGTTYSEAAAYLKANGKSASGLMDQATWQRHKNNNNSAGGEHEASSYQEYLAAYIYGVMNQ